jgi:uncharacterized protein YlzI (FlbEa/FlbD family)
MIRLTQSHGRSIYVRTWAIISIELASVENLLVRIELASGRWLTVQGDVDAIFAQIEGSRNG